MSLIDELQEILKEIVGIFLKKECNLYESNLIIIQVTEKIDKLTQGKDPYKIHSDQSVTIEVPEDNIAANSIQKIGDEIPEDIGYIFIREELFKHELRLS